MDKDKTLLGFHTTMAETYGDQWREIQSQIEALTKKAVAVQEKADKHANLAWKIRNGIA